MGHVSDFNGMNTCDETDLSQTPSELISTDNLLDLHLNESLLPISNSLTDGIYRQSSLYTPDGLSFDDRNGYLDVSMFDFLLENNLGIDFDTSDADLVNGSLILESDPTIVLGSNENEEELNIPEVENDIHLQVPSESQTSRSEADSISESPYDKNTVKTINNFDPNSEFKIYTAEAVFKSSESYVKEKTIPNIIIRCKPESKVTEQEFNATEFSAPMTIADNVKLGRRRNGGTKTDSSDHSKKVVDITHKKKSLHKRRQHSVQRIKKRVPDLNQNFKSKLQNSPSSDSSSYENMYQTDKTVSDFGEKPYNTYPAASSRNSPLSNDGTPCSTVSSPVDTDYFSYHEHHGFNNSSSDAADFLNGSSTNGNENEPCMSVDTVDSFQFDFEDGNILPMPSSLDNPKELTGSIDGFLEHFDVPLGDGHIPESNKSLVDDMESMKVVGSSKECSFSSLTDKEDGGSFKKDKYNGIQNRSLTKGSSASELIDELHAHNQQVFEEIEVSTPELELELCEPKTSIQLVHPETSHQLLHCANNYTSKQNVSVTEHVENDMNSQNHLPITEASCTLPSRTVSTANSVTHNGTARSRNVSSSSSIISKSSTSHRCYRKRQSRMSTSSSSSDGERFYNRQVNYNAATDAYCDEFGREIRPSQLKYYLNYKSQRDSHSNNCSSSSTLSRSKSPRHRPHHLKHHKSRSNRKRQYSSSRSRSRSPGRKRKDDNHHKYRSPSPKPRSRKPHYMDLEENVKANEERRVMYVGDIPPGYTIEQLKERFGQFGPIQDCTIKSKTTSDCSLYIFGFVTFKNRSDACNAIDNGNSNPSWPKFDLNFGGRRRFCNGNYTDLDGKVAEAESGWYSYQPLYRHQPVKKDDGDDDFAELLKQEQRRLGMSKK